MKRNALMDKLREHPLVDTLLSLRGNPRYCVYLEPLWGIPYNLYGPFATLFMYNMGVSDAQIGLLLSIGMIFQVLASFFGGVATDKLGRRMTTVIFDCISWSLPCLIWVFAQNFYWFLAATVLNSMWQITNNSWNCLLVEDCDPKKLVDVYTWCTISGLLAVFFAPISGTLVEQYSLVPVMRGLYFFSFASMTAKFLILFFMGHETAQGRLRMQQTHNQSMLELTAEYKQVFVQIMKSRETLFALGLMVVCNITGTLSGTFYSLYVVQNLGISEGFIAIFPMLRAVVMILFIFLWQAKINRLPFKPPMLAGLALFILSQLLLILAPAGGGIGTWISLVGYILAEAFGNAIFMPRKESLVALCVDPQERARICGLLYVIMIAICTPFGWIGGILSQINRIFPFMLNIALYTIMGVLILRSKTLLRISEQYTP